MFRIIFVLDLLNGNAVHAMRGERATYQPVRNSRVCNSSDPLEIVSVLRPEEVYIADLDRLQHLGDNLELIKKISGHTKTLVNIGIERKGDIEKCIDIADTVVLSTEASSLDLIGYASGRPQGKIDVTIDLKNGKVLTEDERLRIDPVELVKLLNEYDIEDIIIIDLGRVGTGAGINEDLLREAARISHHNVLFGGGIRDMNDINALKETGVNGALVATAVHNGKIPVEMLRGNIYDPEANTT